MKVIILGTAPHSFPLAPFANKDWDVWACSPGTIGAPRIDVFFELHRYEPGQPWFSEGYVNFLKKHPLVWMAEQVNDIPGCQVLPAQALVEKYGPYFFTSSIAWMMAMAIEAGAEKIAMYGIDMAATEEIYSQQRAGCQYFAMIARSLGIEVGVPPESDVLRPPPLYGVCETSHIWIKQLSRKRDLQARVNEATQQRLQLEATINFLTGALDDLQWHQTSWSGNTDSLGKTYIEPPLVPVLRSVIDPTERHPGEAGSPAESAEGPAGQGNDGGHPRESLDSQPRTAD